MVALVLAATAAFAPAPARADSGSLDIRVVAATHAPHVDVVVGATRDCEDEGCPWFAELRVVAHRAGCLTRGDTPWVGPLERGSGSRSYFVRYATTTGPRHERLCLLIWQSRTDEPRLIAHIDYRVPAPGEQPPPPGEGPGPGDPQPGGGNPNPPGAGDEAAEPLGPSLFPAEARRALRSALLKRHGARWVRSRKPLLKCVRTARGAFRCRAWFKRGRRWHSVRARVFAAEGARVVANFT